MNAVVRIFNTNIFDDNCASLILLRYGNPDILQAAADFGY
jgi:hypothetical protein